MNFVDVQPQSFLDYAWTSPAPSSSNAPKTARTSRKQNRCCDQCRKGKRACDAAILEDALLSANGVNSENPTTFHYSDVFGPLAPCGNCEKTKKTCTFEWLRSQRISQASPPQPSPTPPAKKRRTTGSPSQDREDEAGQLGIQQASPTAPSAWMANTEPANIGVTFADFPCGIPFDGGLTQPPQHGYALTEFLWDNATMMPEIVNGHSLEECRNVPSLEWNSSLDSSVDTASPETNGRSTGESSPSGTSAEDSDQTSDVVRIPRKRRRRASSVANTLSHTPMTLTNNLLSSANSAYLADGLLKIYHDSFETHLSCWVTENTCPYSKDCDVSLPNNCGPDWNRIYHRVFKLDQSPSVRGRSLSRTEDRAASKALNLAIFSFASQWAVPDSKWRVRYPFHIDEKNRSSYPPLQRTSNHTKFDRALQLTAWHQANKAIQEATDIESFRMVLAHIVFSLTQKPEGDLGQNTSKTSCEQGPGSEENGVEDGSIEECEDLMAKLDLTMNDDVPSFHLEQGLRLIHSLRARMTMAGAFGGRKKKKPRCWKHLQARGLEASDRATVDVLFWLGIMFDTLSSAMHKRPLVVSLEDSDLPAIRNVVREEEFSLETPTPSDPKTDDWDDVLFRRRRNRDQRGPVRWPCSEDEAASLLCDAAPIKVLLFRKVTRIQTLLARHAQGEKTELAVHSALEVYEYWQKMYAPFFRDCIINYDALPERVQSWYVCLAGHWHLATLLLADLIETMDETESGIQSRRRERDCLSFVARFRFDNCRSLSDIARCACSQQEGILSQAQSGVFSIGQGALLSEPWSDVLIRAFAIAGAVLLESPESPNGSGCCHDDSIKRAGHCIEALRFLGQRSDKARLAAGMLSEELELRIGHDYTLFPPLGASTVACAG